ncbi:MAG: DNA-protecting protein DprA [Cyanomargarita calcarea GSE-NOS-MK-12-04C]|uniref:DNA-protecting protein DprA n=1 Tax=Cyanomargarita calcarea GSE-NOS-MK-12-04C TaxID=2839659 RepID=A0A951QKJ8_9CYAN|nr:DNA-protecting protein DprA [Cyanomargarita calcarea GSE-NOS-MK-12-04C]
MPNHVLQPDTQAILLLCASFGQNRKTETAPLTLGEYNLLAAWLQENQMRPADLLSSNGKKQLEQITVSKLDFPRLSILLERGVMLSFAVEKWTNQGLWILGRSDSQYPKRLKQKLKHSAPAILYGIGDIELLSMSGLAIIGSRDVDEEGINYTRRIAQTCASSQMQVVSGGARGVDEAAILAVLEVGGKATAVLADSLSKVAVQSKYRAAIMERRLTLISSYDPDAGFNVGNAMGRNKYIYGLSDYALVVSSQEGKGGTWAGAVEALKNIKDVPVFVRVDTTSPSGNQELLLKGAKPFPSEPWDDSLQEVLESAKSDQDTPLANPQVEIAESSKEIYEAVLPIILNYLQQPMDAKSLAESLDVRQGQMQDWLDKAVKSGRVTKIKKPLAYVVNQEAIQLSLLNTLDCRDNTIREAPLHEAETT